MRPFLSAEQQAFREDVQAFLADHADVRSFFAHEGQADVDQRRLYRALGERNWLAIAWPPEAGGLGRPPVYEFILWDEMAYARAARPPIGSGIVAKTIIAHGTDEQKERFLPGLRTRRTVRSPSATPSPRPAPTSAGCARGRCATAIATSSPARSAGRRPPIGPTTCGCCAAPARWRAGHVG